MKIFSLFLMLLLVSCDNSTVNTRLYDKGVSVVNISDTNGSTVLSYSGSYALVIGQSDYTAGWADLNSIPRELDKVEAVLKDQGFVVDRKSDLNSRDLKLTFDNFINKYGYDKNNRLLFFYSGHGHSRGDKGYIVPVDAPNPHSDDKGFFRKAVAMNQVVTWARNIESKHALFLFDSCFSGTVFKSKNIPIPKQISGAMAKPVRQFITAGSAKEEVPAKSTFTPAFVHALAYGDGDSNNDGYITGMELGLYLWNEVPKHTDQTPQYGKIKDFKLSRGDFVFKVKNKSRPAVINVAELDSVKREKAELARIRRQKEAALADLADAKREKVELARIRRQKEAVLADLADVKREKVELARIKIQRKSKVFQDSLRSGGLGPKMVRIRAGSFRMGDIQGGGDSDEKPVHRVSVGKFAMGMYEVTFAEYDKFADATGRKKPSDSGWGRGNRPVIHVSWNDATAYAKWLSNQTGKKYRLPTEAEWEYAARAGTETKYWWGNEIDKSKANYGWNFGKTSPVGNYKANQFGLYDTSGNVWEWTCSLYEGKYKGKEKQCVINANRLSLRGGSWNNYGWYVRSASRDRTEPATRNYSVGFRVSRL
ncbi:SUMF1/EgtB/PvdO family nonheme iron enzyme [Candidatus Marithrix sp. Canyon 246]|uniref:SUMF1/EgtB/PvdO family nonheme iron enzyme n=2 Tax=Candidatus Marithrix sp. Canyon 246 TaxID=1827136 RepID=UPI0009F5E873|nr:SUMF1/EgtB/PvdO family nonheme iron enzyme [Candidatus Marithrix sp. Canyon 246]